MSISLTGDASAAGNADKDQEFNEFTCIQGLNPAMLRWLRESFDVQTVADLARLSINRVLYRLQDEGKPFSYGQIEHWITQAQAFAAAQTAWKPFATFVVSLQTQQIGGQTQQRTIAYFVEADKRAIWSGIECNGVYELMLDQLKQAFQLQPEVSNRMESKPQIESELRNQNSSQSEFSSVLEAAEQAPIHEPDRQPELIDECSFQLESETQAEPLADSLSEPEAVAEVVAVEVENPELKSHCSVPAKSAVDEKPLDFATVVASESETEVEPDVAVAKPLILKITQLKFWQPPAVEKSVAEDAEAEELEPKTAKAKKVKAKKAEAEESGPEPAIIVNMAKRSLPGMLHAAEPFQMEVTFQLTGAGVVEVTRESLNYHIQCFMQNREGWKGVHLESSTTGTFTEKGLVCTRRLPAMTSLQPGLYRLQVVAQSKNGQASPDFFELPFVQVV